MKLEYLRKLLNNLKFDWNKLPPEFQTEFDHVIFRSNFSRTRIIAIVLLIASVPLLYIDYINYKSGLWELLFGYRHLFYTHILLSAAMLVQIIIILNMKINPEKSSPRWQKTCLTAIIMIQFTITAVISTIDQEIHGQITSYIMGAIWFGVFIYNKPLMSLFTYLFSFSLFAVGIYLTQKDPDILQGHYINSTLLIAISWVVSVTMYKNRLNEFLIKKELHEQANIDYLTGCLNRRALINRLEQEISRARREGATTSILLIDIDFFKQVNDKFGHLFGDYVLKEVVNTLNDSCRDYDFIGRLGGEEFIMCLSNTTLQVASDVAERLRSIIGNAEIVYDGNLINITVSLGVASLEPLNNESIDTFISRADRAMYQAKKTRNNVCLSSFN